MKFIFGTVFFLFQTLIYSQGTILEYGESGTIVTVNKSKFGKSKRTLHSLLIGYSYKRKIDIGLESGLIDNGLDGNVRTAGGYFSSYLGGESNLNLRASLLVAKVWLDNSDWNKAVNITAFYSKYSAAATFTPRVGATFDGGEGVGSDYGFDFFWRGEKMGFVFGLSYIVPPEFSNFMSFSVGVLFL